VGSCGSYAAGVVEMLPQSGRHANLTHIMGVVGVFKTSKQSQFDQTTPCQDSGGYKL